LSGYMVHRLSEQDLTVMAPRGILGFVLLHPTGVIPRSVGDVDQSAQPC
jgi:hypothetical protein